MSFNILPFFSRQVPRNIIRIPDKRLRKPSARVISFGQETNRIVKELLDTVKNLDATYNPWLGMSAVQLGYPK